jgi:LPXTG-motif cell wall-anchored protein
VTPTEEPTPEVTPTEEPTPEVTPTEEPTPEVTPTEEPTPEVTPTEEPTPEVTPTDEPTPEVTPTEEPTPTTHRVIVCHWVPAHEGSVVRLEIDEDGLAGHAGHQQDLVGPVDDLTFPCDTEVDPAPVTPTEPTDPTEPSFPTDPSSPFGPEDSSDNASGTVDDVTSSSAVPTELAHTGTQASSIALLGAGLLAAGTFVLVAGRKRREV